MAIDKPTVDITTVSQEIPSTSIGETTTTLETTTKSTPATTISDSPTSTTTTTTTTSDASTSTTTILLSDSPTTVTTTTTSSTSTSTTTTTPTTSTTTIPTTTTTTTTTTPKPLCLDYSCVTQPSLLDASNYINTSVGAPIGGVLKIACDKMYFFSDAAADWPGAASQCCARNMKLVSFETAADYLCFSKMLQVPNYGLGGAWWTSGSNIFSGFYLWCTGDLASNVTSDIKFVSGEPNNAGGNENCIEMVVGGGTPPNNLLMNDRPCTAYTTRYVCETTALGCPFPQCPALPCQTEAAKVTASQNWKGNSDGVFRPACGHQYFFSKVGMTWADAMTECCKYGMKLMSINSFEDISCLTAMNKVLLKDTSSFYWTSGTSNGFGCEFTYGFCGSMKLLYQNFSNWWPGMPDLLILERCLEMRMALDPTQVIINDLTCTSPRYFICEAEQKACSPTCPSKSTCVKQNNLFNSKGELLNAFNFGRWATGSSKTYLFATMAGVTWAAANTACCNLGMDFLSIASDQEMQDIFNLNNNDPLLRYNAEFWTSGTQLDCNFHYTYCSTGVNFYWNDTKWLSGEPDNLNEQQWCVFSRFGTASTYSKSAAYLADAPCTESRNYICQMPALPCTSVPCYDNNCIVDPAKSAQVTAMSGPDGQFKTFCNKMYFLHKDSMSFQNAYDTCCSFGLKLLSVETDAERVCLHDGFNSAGWPSGSIWTSGTDVGIGCVNKYGWCPDGQFLNSNSHWCAGEPSSPYVENCVDLVIKGGDSSSTCFNDNTCSKTFRFVCEA
ncbi:macrophage mannose receptor 1-like [Cloeon dipterum]|uniref:macrophage mannose receptor 1-like n=1 Tax=Cloeon dipterum TaxID=197152 RepID=UPI0032202540